MERTAEASSSFCTTSTNDQLLLQQFVKRKKISFIEQLVPTPVQQACKPEVLTFNCIAVYIHTLLLRLVMTSTTSCRTACSMCVCLRVLIEFPRLFSFIIHSRCHRASLTVKNCEKYSLQKNYLYNRCISIRVCTITSMYLVVYPILLFVCFFFFFKV